MIIYADVLFLINFSMDFLALFFCARVFNTKVKKARIITSSVFGASYATVQVLFPKDEIYYIFVSVAIAVIMVMIAYNEVKPKRYILLLMMYLFISATLGGIMSAIYALFNKILKNYVIDTTIEGTYNGARNLIIIGLTVLSAMILMKTIISKRDIKSVDIKITLYGKNYNIIGLCDSGNLLTEPFSGKKVILVSDECALGKCISATEPVYKKIIPYKDVTTSGILYGIVPSTLIINDNEVDAVIASVKNKNFNGYDALVPSSLL